MLFLGVLSGAPVRATGPAGLTLFTAHEAKQLRMGDGEWRVRHTRSTAPLTGPHIVVRSPQLLDERDGQTIETATPASLVVLFEPGQAPVDMGSLQITARKGFFSKSLTDLLKPYVNGSALQVKDVSIPEGKFLIEIAIADANGSKTVATYRLLVKAP